MRLKAEIAREVLTHVGEKAVRGLETMEVTIEYDGDGNILKSAHPDKTYGHWSVVKIVE